MAPVVICVDTTISTSHVSGSTAVLSELIGLNAIPRVLQPPGFSKCACGANDAGQFNDACPKCTHVLLRMATLPVLFAKTPLVGKGYGPVPFHTSFTVSLWCY